MAPSLRDIRRAATKKRKVHEANVPAEREVAAPKAVSETEAPEMPAGSNVGERPSSPPRVSSPIDLTQTPEKEVGKPPSPPIVPEVEPVAPASPFCPEAGPSSEGVGAEPVQVDGSEAGPADAAAGSGGEEIDVSFQSILSRHTRWAEEVITNAAVPEVQRYLQSQRRSVFFREAHVALLWSLNSLTAMRGLWDQSQIALDQAYEEIREVKARAEIALETARAETARIERAEADLGVMRLRAEKAEYACEVAERRAANELDNAQVAEEKQKEAEEKLKAVESELYLLQGRLHSATIEIGVAEERAENAEEIARRSDAEIANLRAAKTKAEDEMAEARKKAIEAVDDFRKSAAYDKELAETTAFAYNGGFQDCKDKIRKIHNLEGLEDLQPDDDEGSDSATAFS